MLMIKPASARPFPFSSGWFFNCTSAMIEKINPRSGAKNEKINPSIAQIFVFASLPSAMPLFGTKLYLKFSERNFLKMHFLGRVMSLIEFIQIEKSFKNQKVIKGVNLLLNEKDFFGLLGKSGSGKTTLMKLLIGFYRVDNGRILYHHEDVTNNPEKIRRVVGFCTQDNSFYSELTVEENLLYYGRLYGISTPQLKMRISKVLEQVSLSEHAKKLSKSLSGGMKRRLDLAISLIHDPAILILDEPTTGLDPVVQTSIWNLIHAINRSGKTILVSTHHLEYLEKRCTQVGVLHNGYMVAVASPQQLMKQHGVTTLNDAFSSLVKEVSA